MTKSLVGALALASLPSALAFRNTSPLFLFSTTALDIPSDSGDIAQSSLVEDQIKKSLDGCPSKAYVLVRQEGVSSLDFVNGRSAPRLGHYLSGNEADVKSTLVVPEVLESKVSKSLSEYIQNKCSAEVVQGMPSEAKVAAGGPYLIEVSFAAPSSSQRSAELAENDAQLEALVAAADALKDYTVIYTTTPPTEEQAKAVTEDQRSYEMEDPFGGAVQMELKRDLSAHKRASNKQGGLFERYQYLSPPLFMGFIGIAPLFAIVFVGLKALTSLEVSYFAFSKEMGPAAQRKQ